MTKFNLRRLSLFFLFFLLVFISQGIAVAGDPVPGAEIYIEQEPNDDPIIIISTDKDGKFSLAAMGVLKKGTYKLYVLKSSIENLDMKGKNFHIDFKVILKNNNMKSLVFSKTGVFDRKELLQQKLSVSSNKNNLKKDISLKKSNTKPTLLAKIPKDKKLLIFCFEIFEDINLKATASKSGFAVGGFSQS